MTITSCIYCSIVTDPSALALQANRTLDGLQRLLTERFGATRGRRKKCMVHP